MPEVQGAQSGPATAAPGEITPRGCTKGRGARQGSPGLVLRLYEADRPQHVTHAGLFFLEEGHERLAGEIEVFPATLLQGLGSLLRLGQLLDGVTQRLALLVRDARTCHDGAPVHDLDVHALLFEGGKVSIGEPLAR